jgi:transposase
MTWNLPSEEAFLPRVSVPELKRRAAKETRARQRTRLLVAVHRKQGKSIDAIAEAVQMHRRSVQDILHRFVDRGLNASESLPKAGRPKRLSSAQLRGLRARLLRSPSASGFKEGFWNTRLVLALVKREYGVEYDASHLRRLLHELGFSVKTPRPKHYQSSPHEVAAFKKKRGWKSSARGASGEPRFAWTNAVS